MLQIRVSTKERFTKPLIILKNGWAVTRTATRLAMVGYPPINLGDYRGPRLFKTVLVAVCWCCSLDLHVSRVSFALVMASLERGSAKRKTVRFKEINNRFGGQKLSPTARTVPVL
jgi:hypothetical protein